MPKNSCESSIGNIHVAPKQLSGWLHASVDSERSGQDDALFPVFPQKGFYGFNETSIEHRPAGAQQDPTTSLLMGHEHKAKRQR
jgi:hypothetical protein